MSQMVESHRSESLFVGSRFPARVVHALDERARRYDRSRSSMLRRLTEAGLALSEAEVDELRTRESVSG